MENILLLIFVILLFLMFSNSEFFEGENKDDDECAKIGEGECSSTLCPKETCKIQHSTTTDKCYCIKRR